MRTAIHRSYEPGERFMALGEDSAGFWGTTWKYTKCAAAVGAYEPHEDADQGMADYFLTGEPRKAARRLVEDAVRRARALPDPYADNATALVARVA
ncbi:hypothetical protein ACFWAT_06510 [Streptomyces syringium]|uniref:hypothetical protein n=1 Tax=Streptomyces syringium TaxID=76729 RepID=UPI003666DB01